MPSRIAGLRAYKKYGRSGLPHLLSMAMWAALRSFEKIDAQLKRLVNRRAAWWNGCQF